MTCSINAARKSTAASRGLFYCRYLIRLGNAAAVIKTGLLYPMPHGMAPASTGELESILSGGKPARSLSSTFQLLVPPCRLSTIGRRSFFAAGASIVWNTFPVHIRLSTSISIIGNGKRLSRFNSHLPTSLFNITSPRYRGVRMSSSILAL